MKRTIAGIDYLFEQKEIPVEKLHFWVENPRIHAKMYSPYNEEPADLTDPHLQQKVYDNLKGTAERGGVVGELREQIERSGLMDPLIVRGDNENNFYNVLEGNRRLAACKMILEKAETKNRTDLMKRFSSLSCEIAPKNFPDSHVFALLGTLHISGKLDWEAFAKASYVKRRVEAIKKEGELENSATERAAKELGEKKSEIETLIANVNLMKYANETETTKYSFYNVLNRNKVVRKDLEENEILKKRWVDSISKWRGKAVDYRSAIQETIKDLRSLKKFRDGKLDLESAAQQAQDSGSTDVIYQKAKRFRVSIVNAKPRLRNTKPTDVAFQKLKFEFGKLGILISDINKILDK